MGARLKYNDGKLSRSAREFDDKLAEAVRLVVDVHATRGEAAMKVSAPWSDRTGAARTGLHTATSHSINESRILFAHSVHYGIWLEVKDNGKYEVIMPTVLATGRNLMQDLDKLMRDI